MKRKKQKKTIPKTEKLSPKALRQLNAGLKDAREGRFVEVKNLDKFLDDL